MSCLPTEEQLELVALARDFVKKELTWEKVRRYDETGEFPMEEFKKAADVGLTLLTMPEEYGGLGQGQFTSALVMEELAKGDAGFSVIIGACELGVTPVLLAGTEEQKRYMVNFLAEGKLAAFALTEAEAGSDVAACRATARREGDEYIINGTKSFISNGGVASVYTVFATVDSSKGAKGLTAFIVERDRPGVSAGKEENKMGIRLSNTTDVVFDEVRIPVRNRVGEEGAGFKIAMNTLDRTRPTGSAAAVGICQSAIDQCIRYGKERKTFGKPIISNQAIQFMLADMQIQTQAARMLVWQSAKMVDEGKVDPCFSAVVKAFGGDTAMKVATDAVQIFGGYGYSKEYPVEILMRNAKIYQIFEGTNQIQRMVISKSIIMHRERRVNP